MGSFSRRGSDGRRLTPRICHACHGSPYEFASGSAKRSVSDRLSRPAWERSAERAQHSFASVSKRVERVTLIALTAQELSRGHFARLISPQILQSLAQSVSEPG